MATVPAGRQRKAQRLVHLGAAVVLFAYMYAPIGAQLENVVRFSVLPVLMLTGIVMWKAAWIRRTLRHRKRP